MFDNFSTSAYAILDRPTYHDGFYRHLAEVTSLDKLERGQHFQERGFPSWEAFTAGNWDQALDLVTERRPLYARQVHAAQQRGRTERRLRVVKFPITPYVQWEMHVLRVRVGVGDEIRVLDARTIADIEQYHPVPEVVILGDTVMYGVRYDEDGNPAGTRRYHDPALIRETRAGFQELYARAEGFETFFDREIAPLAPPTVDHA